MVAGNVASVVRRMTAATLESERIEGEAVPVNQLWKAPFSIRVPDYLLRPGENQVYVRIHNKIRGAGIHRPVRTQLHPPEKKGLIFARTRPKKRH